MFDEHEKNQTPEKDHSSQIYSSTQPQDNDYNGYGYDYQAQVGSSSGTDGVPPHFQPSHGGAIPPNDGSDSSVMPPNPPEKKKSALTAKLVAVVIACALIGGAAGGAITATVMGSSASPSSTSNISIDENYNSAVEAIAAKDLPSVVGIVLTSKTTNNTIPFFNQQKETAESVSEGSGVIYKEDGYIITNYHVISEAVDNKNASISVYLNDGSDSSEEQKGYDASIIGYDAGADLAVIKIDAGGLTPIELGNSDELQVGQNAVAIGNPGGMDFMGSVSEGIVSGLNRTLTLENGVEMNLIQTDAAINPGNSGGALVDGTGKIIGICSAKLASTDFEGMGFAIPINDAISICDGLIANEGKTSPYLGVTLDTRYTAEALQQLGYPSGVVVASVAEGSPAQTAGINAGDIITKINDTAIPSYDVLKSELNKYNVGDTISIELYRLSATTTVQVTLGETSSQS